MYIAQPVTLTEIYLDSDSTQNKYKGLLNANFQDYMDSMTQSGQLQVKAQQLKQRISTLVGGLGMAAGALGGPHGLALGYAVGSTVGKYLGNVLGDRVYGQAITDMSEIVHESRVRHSQLAASLAFQQQMDGAVDTLRQNENKRRKDDLQAMQV